MRSIPQDVMRTCIAKYLSDEDKAALEMSNTYFYQFFQNSVKNVAEKLLSLVAQGNENLAEAIVIRNPLLMFEKNRAQEYCARSFPNISPLQFAYWARDWDMLEMLLKNLPKEGKKAARKQLNEVKTKGVEYEFWIMLEGTLTPEMIEELGASLLDGRTNVILRQAGVQYKLRFIDNYDNGKTGVAITIIGEKNYDYQPIIQALKRYLKHHQEWKLAWELGNNQDRIKLEEILISLWHDDVRIIQHSFTAFLAQQYCHPDRSFEKVTFDEAKLNRSLKCQLWAEEDTFFSWFNRSHHDLGILRGAASFAEARPYLAFARPDWSVSPQLDLLAIERLNQISPEKLANIERLYLEEEAPCLSQNNNY